MLSPLPTDFVQLSRGGPPKGGGTPITYAATLSQLIGIFGSGGGGLFGGVQQLVAGPNIILSPADGKGIVQISATGGGGSGGITQLTGDVTAGPGFGPQVASLPIVNSTPGTFGFATITADDKGRITSISENGAPGQPGDILINDPGQPYDFGRFTPAVGVTALLQTFNLVNLNAALTGSGVVGLTTTNVLSGENTFNGVSIFGGAITVPPVVDDVLNQINVARPASLKPLTGNVTETFSATPPNGRRHIRYYSADNTNRTVTLPANVRSMDHGGIVQTSFVVQANTEKAVLFEWRAGNAYATGLGPAVTGTGSFVMSNSPTLVTPNLGTPSAVNLSNGTNLPLAGLSGLAANVATFLGTPSSANFRAVMTDESGTGALLFANGAFGTPTQLVLTNATLLPLSTGVTGRLAFTNLAQASAASVLLGRGSAAGAGDFQEITLGANLTLTGTVLSASGGGGGGSPGGADTQVQYNNSGAFGGNAAMTFNAASGLFTLTAVSPTANQANVISILRNTTAASAGNQQWVSQRWSGQGWKTNSTAASQPVDYIWSVVPIEGAANPSGQLRLQSQINNGSVIDILDISASGGTMQMYAAAGSFRLGGSGFLGWASGTTNPRIYVGAGANDILLTSGAQTTFGTLALGLATTGAPGISRNGTRTRIGLGDGSVGGGLDAVSILANSDAAEVGFSGAGSGGAVTQITSRSTSVTLNKINGEITTATNSLAVGAAATFAVTNSKVLATDHIDITVRGGQTNVDTDVSVTAVTAGSFNVTVKNGNAVTAEVGAIRFGFKIVRGTIA